MWYDTKGASSSNSTHVPTSQQRDSIQVLHSNKVYHFDDVNACFVKNLEDGFLKRLLKLPTIVYHHIFDIRKMTMEKLEAYIQCLDRLQQANGAKYEATWKMRLEKKAKHKPDAKAKRIVAV